MTRISAIRFLSMLWLCGLALAALVPDARAEQVAREQDIANLRLGQRIKVDDGTCPAGQIKQVSGARMVAAGGVPPRKCAPRLGPQIQ